jgi:predicted RND superfamily exporter protein
MLGRHAVHRSWKDWSLLAALLAPVLLLLQAPLPVDVENAAMKSRGTPEAADMALRRREFGDQHVVLLLLEPRGEERRLAPDEPVLGALPAELRRLPGVVRVRPIPRPRRDAWILAIEVAGDQQDGGYAEAVGGVMARASDLVPPTLRLSVGGQPVGEIAIAEAVAAEQGRMVPLVAAGLFLLLLLRYRDLILAGSVVLPAFVGIGCVAFLQRALGQRLDPVAALLHPVLLTIGVASAVHVAERSRHWIATGRDAAGAARLAVTEILRPAALSAGTTMAGFLSLTTNSIPAVARFGIMASVGALLAYALPMLVTPLVLRLALGPRGTARIRRMHLAGADLGAGVALALARRARPLVAAATTLGVLGALLWPCLSVQTDPARILPESHPFRVASARLGQLLGGTETVDLLLPPRSPRASTMQLSLLELQLMRQPGVKAMLGPAQVSTSGAALIQMLLEPGTAADREARIASATAAAERAGFAGARVTGTHVQVARDSERLVHGQQAGIAAMLAVLFLFMAAGLRSWRMGLLGLVPNALPCALLYGGMALAGQELTVASAMIGSVMLGLVVDNTIHLLHHYLLHRRCGSAARVAVARALSTAGPAVLTSCLVLALGFALACTGSLATTREFGLLSATAIAIALACNLLLLPCLLLCSRGPRPAAFATTALPCPHPTT